jgi:thiamine monophosphate synthase
LHETETKPDCGLDENGKIITRSFVEIAELARLSPLPVVVGGGIKLADIPKLEETGIGGFFVVSAVCGAASPKLEAAKLVEAWNCPRLARAAE